MELLKVKRAASTNARITFLLEGGTKTGRYYTLFLCGLTICERITRVI